LERHLIDGVFDVIVSPERFHRNLKEIEAIATVATSGNEEVNLIMIRPKSSNSIANSGSEDWWKFAFPNEVKVGIPVAPPKYDLIYEKDTISQFIWDESLHRGASEEVLPRLWPSLGMLEFETELKKLIESRSPERAREPILLLLTEPKLAWLQSFIVHEFNDWEVQHKSVSYIFPEEEVLKCNYKIFVRKNRINDVGFRNQLIRFMDELEASYRVVNSNLMTMAIALRTQHVKELAYSFDMDLMFFAKCARKYDYAIGWPNGIATTIATDSIGKL
jgi:hypothetical protein